MLKKIVTMIKEKGFLNTLALLLVIQSANTACLWTVHQPEFPKAADRYRKRK